MITEILFFICYLESQKQEKKRQSAALEITLNNNYKDSLQRKKAPFTCC